MKVGQLIGQGEIDCITAWNVASPNILIMDGDPTDNNAKLFAQGYNGLLEPKFGDGTYTKVGEPAGTWDPPTAATTFQQQFTAHPNINAVVTPNDDNANAVIAILQGNQVPAKTFPTTGQDASPSGLQNILKGYQCGTVYKPIYLEAQAAAALALYLRAGSHATRRRWSTRTPGHDDQQGHRVRLHDADLGDHREHGGHRREGRRGQGGRPVRRGAGERVHGGRHQLARPSSAGPHTAPSRGAAPSGEPVEGETGT